MKLTEAEKLKIKKFAKSLTERKSLTEESNKERSLRLSLNDMIESCKFYLKNTSSPVEPLEGKCYNLIKLLKSFRD